MKVVRWSNTYPPCPRTRARRELRQVSCFFPAELAFLPLLSLASLIIVNSMPFGPGCVQFLQLLRWHQRLFRRRPPTRDRHPGRQLHRDHRPQQPGRGGGQLRRWRRTQQRARFYLDCGWRHARVPGTSVASAEAINDLNYIPCGTPAASRPTWARWVAAGRSACTSMRCSGGDAERTIPVPQRASDRRQPRRPAGPRERRRPLQRPRRLSPHPRSTGWRQPGWRHRSPAHAHGRQSDDRSMPGPVLSVLHRGQPCCCRHFSRTLRQKDIP